MYECGVVQELAGGCDVDGVLRIESEGHRERSAMRARTNLPPVPRCSRTIDRRGPWTWSFTMRVMVGSMALKVASNSSGVSDGCDSGAAGGSAAGW